MKGGKNPVLMPSGCHLSGNSYRNAFKEVIVLNTGADNNEQAAKNRRIRQQSRRWKIRYNYTELRKNMAQDKSIAKK